MKVIAFNGSPNAKGNTFFALTTVAEELTKENIETELVNLGKYQIKSCIACGSCSKNQDEKCVLPDDPANEWIQKIKNADGMILGSPVHFSAMSANLKAFADRAFYVAAVNGGLFWHKVGASVAAVRRSGGVTTFNQLNNYFLLSEMLLPASNYWNVIHGDKKGEVLQDPEGLQIMRVLAKNIAWALKLIENGKHIGTERETKILTNFIR